MNNIPESERQIYGPYHNGIQEIFGDPLALYRRLVHALGGDPNQVLRDLRADDEPTRFEATEKMLVAAVFTFSLQPFDQASGAGVLEKDQLKLVKDFIGWIEQKKKTPVNSPTSPPLTDTPLSA